MAAIRHLCERTVVLENGRLGFDGQTHQAVLYHHQQCENLHLVNLDPASDTEPFALIGIRVSGQGQEPACLGLPLFFNFAFRTSLVLSNHSVVLSFRVDNALGEHCLWLGSGLLGFRIESPFVEFSLEKCPLPPGKYQLTVSVRIGGDKAVWRQNVASFEVVSGDFFGTGKLIPPKQQVLYTDFTIRNLNAWEH
jgi:lipopolysaccharide transport system ATP-binding protein